MQLHSLSHLPSIADALATPAVYTIGGPPGASVSHCSAWSCSSEQHPPTPHLCSRCGEKHAHAANPHVPIRRRASSTNAEAPERSTLRSPHLPTCITTRAHKHAPCHAYACELKPRKGIASLRPPGGRRSERATREHPGGLRPAARPHNPACPPCARARRARRTRRHARRHAMRAATRATRRHHASRASDRC